jgi:hypothetical protein
MRKRIVISATNSVIKNQKDINTALREAEEAINKEIAKVKSGQ